MPLIQIDLMRELYDRQHEAIEAAIHDAQIEALGIPSDDRFQVFRPHDDGELRFDPTYGNVDRRSLILIHVTMVDKYDVSTKQDFYRAVVRRLGALDIRSEDVLLCIVENAAHDWYAGKIRGE